MANRIPLVLDETNGRLQELPNADNLDLSGNNIIGLSNLTTTGGITVGGTVNVTGTVNASIVNATNMAATAITTTSITATGTIEAGNYTLGGLPLLEQVVYDDVIDVPIIPSDINQLADADNLLSGGFDGDYNSLINKPSSITQFDVIDGTAGQFLSTDGAGFFAFQTITLPTPLSAFTQLEDVPSSYTGQAGGVLTVAVGEDGMQFTAQNQLSVSNAQVVAGLGFTPYNNTNPAGYIFDGTGVENALGFTPYNGATNSLGFLTAEADTLDSVLGRGNTTTSNIGVGDITSSGVIGGASLSLTGNIQFTAQSGTLSIDGQVGSTLNVGSSSVLTLNSLTSIGINKTLVSIPTTPAVDLGTTGIPFKDLYIETIGISGAITNSSTDPIIYSSQGRFELSSATNTLALVGNTRIELGSRTQFPSITRAQRDALTGSETGDVVFVGDDNTLQVYVADYGIGVAGVTPTWVSLHTPYGPEPAIETVYAGMLAVADGTQWDPEADGQEHLMVYLNGAFVTVV